VASSANPRQHPFEKFDDKDENGFSSFSKLAGYIRISVHNKHFIRLILAQKFLRVNYKMVWV
jgi:hypothetical protein